MREAAKKAREDKNKILQEMPVSETVESEEYT